jgi:hypothetical protein
MVRWLYVLVIGAVLSGFAFLLLTGQYINEGPVVASVSREHGLHAGDLLVIAGWVVSVAALVGLAMSPRPRGAS